MGQTAKGWAAGNQSILAEVHVAPQSLERWSAATSHDFRVAYTDALRGSDWESLSRLGAVAQARSDRVLGRMAAAQRRLARQMTSLASPPKDVQTALETLHERRDWPQIRKAALRKVRELGGPAELVEQLSAQLDQGIDPLRSMTAPVAYLSDQLDALATTHLRVASGAALALCVARFNELVASPPPQALDAATVLQQADRSTNDRYHAFWSACRRRQPRKAMAAARALASVAQPDRASLSELLIVAAQQAAPDPGTDSGFGCIDVARGVRSLLTAAAVGRWSSWMLLRTDPYQGRNTLFGRAEALALHHHPADPTVHHLNEVIRHPGKFRGRPITVQGVVETMTSDRTGSRATLVAGGHSLSVTTRNVLLPEVGVATSAHVRATGKLSDSDDPVLVIGYTDTAAAAKTTFLAWLQAQCGPTFRAVPHDLSVESSWVPGPEGAGNQLKYGIWFS